MKSGIGPTIAYALLAALTATMGTVRPADAQQTITTLAAMDLPVVPRHHHYLWLFSASGLYAAIRLNNDSTATDDPEKVVLPGFIDPGPAGIVLTPTKGVASGTVLARPTTDGWTSYKFSVVVQGAFTRIWDSTLPGGPREAAQGYSSMNISVAYDLSQPLTGVDEYYYSVLGPQAHRDDLKSLGIFIRNFAFTIQLGGSGKTLPLSSRSATWKIANAFITPGASDIGAGVFIVSWR
jgi:hypothetical protein